MRGPIDRRLLASVREIRPLIATSFSLGLIEAALLVVQAVLIADIVVRLHPRWRGGLGASPLILACVLGLRGGVAWGAGVVSQAAASTAKVRLRERFMAALGEASGPGVLLRSGAARAATLLVQGLDALDAYFSKYLAQLALAMCVPVLLLGWLLRTDVLSAAELALTLPLIPIFMVLIGRLTMDRSKRWLSELQLLSEHFVDLVRGLPTLRSFGRGRVQAKAVATSSERLRVATSASLRIAFLSGFALELLAALGVAVVAVSVGLRLVDGDIGFHDALVVLLLAPEVYVPLRNVGAQFHASADGLAALDEVFAVIEEPERSGAGRNGVASGIGNPAPALEAGAVLDPPSLVLRGVDFRWPGRPALSLVGVDLAVEPGELVALVGPSGSGKSTLIALLAGFGSPDAGEVLVGGVSGTTMDRSAWRSRTAWLSQSVHLFSGSIADNVRLARPDADDAEVERVLEAANAGFIHRLPEGAATMVGDGGSGLSAGERQRVGIARALLKDAPLLLLDEPTAHLDLDAAQEVVAGLARLVRGRTGVVATHDAKVVAMCDRTIRLAGGKIVSDG